MHAAYICDISKISQSFLDPELCTIALKGTEFCILPKECAHI